MRISGLMGDWGLRFARPGRVGYFVSSDSAWTGFIRLLFLLQNHPIMIVITDRYLEIWVLVLLDLWNYGIVRH